jgi:hypothetical protein
MTRTTESSTCRLWLLLLQMAAQAMVVSSSLQSAPDFFPENAMPRGNIKDLRFVSRIMVPYGPNLFGEPPLQTAQDRPWQGYGFGMNAVEKLTYDTKEKYAYLGSSVGFVTVVDFARPQEPVLTDYAIVVEEDFNDLAVRTI